MKLLRSYMPMLVIVLLTAVLAPLCVAAGVDGGTDPCCEVAAQLASTGWIKTIGSGLAAVLGVTALTIAAAVGSHRLSRHAASHASRTLALSAAPLRI